MVIDSISLIFNPRLDFSQSIKYNMRLSGLQKEVLKLYRRCLREARKKPSVSFSTKDQNETKQIG
jgi:hypothetical protein